MAETCGLCQHPVDEHERGVGCTVDDCACVGARPTSAEVVRACPFCGGRGCEECGGSGQRVTTHIDAGAGVTMRVHGSAPLSSKAVEALAVIADLALTRMASEPEGSDG